MKKIQVLLNYFQGDQSLFRALVLFSMTTLTWVLYSLILGKFLPAAITQELLVSLSKIFGIAVLFSSLFLITVGFLHERKWPIELASCRYPIFLRVALSLFPITFIVNYILSNYDLFTISDTIAILFFALLLSYVFVDVIPFLFKKHMNQLGLAASNSAFIAFLASLPLFSQTLAFTKSSDFTAFLLFILIGKIIFTSLSYRKPYFVGILIISFFFTNLLINLLNPWNSLSNENDKNASDQDHVVSQVGQMRKTPNIYFLVYDGYVGAETISEYGLDNSKQEKFLKENGFTIYPNIYSIDIFSAESIAPTLDLRIGQLLDLNGRRRVIAGANQVNKVLQSNNYRTHVLLSPYLIINQVPSYDSTYPVEIDAKGFIF